MSFGMQAPKAGTAVQHSVAQADWFECLPQNARLDFETCMVRRRFAGGKAVFREGDPGSVMYRIVSGQVRIRTVSPGGKEALVVVYGPGNVIGAVSVLDGQPRPYDGITECDTVLDALSAEDFHRVAAIHPGVYKAVALSYSAWIRNLHAMFANGLSLEERLARRLDFILDCCAAEGGDGAPGALRIRFTQEMLAAVLAVSRQAICILLQ